MTTNKIVDDLLIPLDFQSIDKPRFCIVVFSSREKHTGIVIDSIERVIHEKENYEVKKLDDSLKSGDSQYEELIGLLQDCSFGIILLDGLRPNVVYEYGVLKGLGKPCIVLLEESAEVDVINYFSEKDEIEISNPRVDMDKHLSDIKDRFYVRYDKYKPQEIRRKIKKEYLKLKSDIDAEFIRMIFPEKETVEQELEGQLLKFNDIYQKKKDQLTSDDKREFKRAIKKIDEIIKKHEIELKNLYYYMGAEILMRFDDFKGMIKLIDPHLENKIEDIDLITLKAHAFAQLKNFKAAIQTIDEAIQLDPHFEGVWHTKGSILEQDNQEDEARLCFKKGAELNDKCSGIHFLYGVSLYNIDQFPAALEQFEKALQLEANDDLFLTWKARSLLKLGEKDEAKKIVEEAICYNDNNASAWHTLGQLASDPEEAIKYFDKSLSIEPDHPGTLCEKAIKLQDIGKTDDSLKLYDKIKEVCSGSKSCFSLIYNIGSLLIHDEKFDDVPVYIDKLLDLGEKTWALDLKALLLCWTGEEEEGVKIFKELIESEPTNVSLWYNQACAFAKLVRIKESIKSLKKAVELDPSVKEEIKDDHDFDKIRNDNKFKKEFG